MANKNIKPFAGSSLLEIKLKQPRSQDLPDIVALNFAINIISRESMIECKNVVGYQPNIYIIDEVEATDIDNEIDFEFAEFVYRKQYMYKDVISQKHVAYYKDFGEL